MDSEDQLLVDGTLLVRGKELLYVGPRLDPESYKVGQYIDARDSLILPPFYNQHTHPSLSLYRGLGVDLPLQEWLEKIIWPLEKEFCKPEMVHLGSQLSALEMIHSGTGALASMDFHSLEVGKAFEEAGLRTFLGEALFSGPTPNAQKPQEAFRYIEKLLSHYTGSDLIHIYLAVHAPFTSDPDLIRKTAQRAKNWDLITTSHVAETHREVLWCKKHFDKTPVELIESTGILETDFILIHGVHLNDSDLTILKKNSIPVIHNPHSNMVLGSGVCRVIDLLDQNIQVGLGTDSAASNNNLSMLKEMQTAGRLQKVISGNAAALKARTVLEMATSNGYKIYRHQRLGQLSPGWKADFQIIDLNGIHNLPSHEISSTLVYSAHSEDVTGLIVNGKVLMKNRVVQTLDEGEILRKVRKYGDQIRKFIRHLK